MTTIIRQTEKCTMYRSSAGMGVCFLDNVTGQQSLWDTEVRQQTLVYLIGCNDGEFNDYITKQFEI